MIVTTLHVKERYLSIGAEQLVVASYLGRAFQRLRTTSRIDSLPVDAGTVAWDGSGDALLSVVRQAAALLGQSFRKLQAYQALYAAGVARGDAAIALAAPSGTGKTTLTLELIRRGWQTYGDEFLLLERATNVVHPFPQAFTIREPSLRLLHDAALAQACRRDALWAHDGRTRTWLAIDPAEVFRRSIFAAPRRLSQVVLLHRAADSRRSTLEPISGSIAALELVPHHFIESLRIEHVWEMADRLSNIPCYRLNLADHRSAADAIEQLAEDQRWAYRPAS
ncbi:MAG: hypothetical protein JO101_06790 [Candidatus Eremiobacteraeota bacterium]|nr:hypothetical protein [Candidatus Eremiobacteraeota bacterium]MBV8355009.1 hypothetical protein [Candidatus Eremiobacteraeota bacterium]